MLIILSEYLKILPYDVSQEANQPPDSWFELKVNTHVYVTGLPDDVTFEEVRYISAVFILSYPQ